MCIPIKFSGDLVRLVSLIDMLASHLASYDHCFVLSVEYTDICQRFFQIIGNLLNILAILFDARAVIVHIGKQDKDKDQAEHGDGDRYYKIN